jgi:hypothetical protein
MLYSGGENKRIVRERKDTKKRRRDLVFSHGKT